MSQPPRMSPWSNERRELRDVVAAIERPDRVDQRLDVVIALPTRRFIAEFLLDLLVLQRIGRAAPRRLRRHALLLAVGREEIHLDRYGRDPGIARDLDSLA